ncbi:MAG TPA: RDD family protein [Nitrososphaerales archaeon]|nr:RDD family protein [Nitrososphaerales archaeon]
MSATPKFCSNCAAPLQPGTAFCPKCGAPVAQASGPAGAPLSGIDSLIREPGAQSYWLRRLFAFVIDAIIVVVVLAVAAVFVAIPTFVFSGTAGLTSLFAGVFPVLAGVILFLYFIVAEVTRGATVGKSAMHLKVVGPKGGNPTLVESLVRNISKIYWILLLLDVVLGLATSKQYTQKLSDKFVGTSVTQ